MASTLEEYVGVYKIDGTEETRVITLEDGTLKSQRGGGAKFDIKPYAEDKFFYESRSTVEFIRGDDGTVTGHRVTQANGNSGTATLTDEEVEVKEIVQVDAAVLENYVGVYELMPGFDITMTVNDNALVGQATGQGAFPLEAYSDREFGFPAAGIIIEFPEGDGKATEFTLKQGGQVNVAKRKN